MHTLCEDKTTANVLKQLHFIVISALSDKGSHELHIIIKLMTVSPLLIIGVEEKNGGVTL